DAWTVTFHPSGMGPVSEAVRVMVPVLVWAVCEKVTAGRVRFATDADKAAMVDPAPSRAPARPRTTPRIAARRGGTAVTRSTGSVVDATSPRTRRWRPPTRA